MRENTYLKLKSRVYEHGNILTWLVVIFIVSTALVAHGHFSGTLDSPFLFFIPSLALTTAIAIVATKSALRFFGNILSYVFVAVICFAVAMSAIAYSPSGLLSGVWIAAILAGVFGTLALAFIIKSTVNPHHMAALSAIVNTVSVMGLLFAVAYIFPDMQTTAETLALQLVGISLVVSLVVSFAVFFINSRAYKLSFSSDKVLAKDWLKDEEFETEVLAKVDNIVSNKGYNYNTYSVHGKRNAYVYRDNQTFVFIPLKISFKEHDMAKSLHRNAKMRQVTFEKIITSVINRFSGLYVLPAVPVIPVFIVPNDKIKRVISYELRFSNFSSALFIPSRQLNNWLDSVNNGDNDKFVAVFPELSDKEKSRREDFKFFTPIDADVNNVDNANTDADIANNKNTKLAKKAAKQEKKARKRKTRRNPGVVIVKEHTKPQ